MADINGRDFSQADLRAIFRTLDDGGTRTDVRATVRRQQGRGVSNDTIRALRESHRRLRRSQGYNVKVGGVRRLRDDNGDLRRVNQLPPRQRLSQSRRPRPPNLPGVNTVYEINRGGEETLVSVSSDQAGSLDQITAEALDSLTTGSPRGPSTGGPRGVSPLRVRTVYD